MTTKNLLTTIICRTVKEKGYDYFDDYTVKHELGRIQLPEPDNKNADIIARILYERIQSAGLTEDFCRWLSAQKDIEPKPLIKIFYKNNSGIEATLMLDDGKIKVFTDLSAVKKEYPSLEAAKNDLFMNGFYRTEKP